MHPNQPARGSPRREILEALARAQPMSRQVCLQCKGGRLLCGRQSCPLLPKIDLANPVEGRLKEEMFGPSTSVFVGWKGYPSVYSGPMTSLEEDEADSLDNPAHWYGMGFDDIVRMRSLLVRGKQRHGVRERGRFVEEMQELALSVKPVDVETRYAKKPAFSLSFSPVSQPMGASGELTSMRIADNPVIPRKVDSIIGDDLKAHEQASALFDRGFDVYYITNVLASGALGAKQERRMVPTRWGITAVDDLLGRRLMGRIRDYPHVPGIEVYENTYLDNHFEVLLIPGGWEYEQFETWSPKTLWTMSYDRPTIVQEHEPHRGRWEYASEEGGGYYAGRFGVAEALDRMRRQGRAVVFREIYEGYVMPVGVWEVRENVRKAMEKRPRRFDTMGEALRDMGSRLTVPVREYMAKSQILRQRRMSDYP
jgi:DNA repair protein NreA